MNFTIIKKLSPVEEIIQQFPLSETGFARVQKDKQEVKDILEGKDKCVLIIVGPCSAWPKEAVLEYAKKLKILEEKVKNKLKLVMRVYIQKPRTTKGWTGPVNQPDPFEFPDIEAGIRYTREMMVKIIELGLPIADEALFTHNSKGFQELLSWVAIGARSAEDQEHRIHASAIDCAVGMKNPTSGSIEIGVNSIVAAQHPHIAAFDGYEVQTHGNLHAHLVLRGSSNGPNYSLEHILEVKQHMEKHHIKNQAVIVDASHDNCVVDGKKVPIQQIEVIFQVMKDLKLHQQAKQLVKGFMLESFIKEGHQKLDPKHPEKIDLGGLSITDPCLSWPQTEGALLELAKLV